MHCSVSDLRIWVSVTDKFWTNDTHIMLVLELAGWWYVSSFVAFSRSDFVSKSKYEWRWFASSSRSTAQVLNTVWSLLLIVKAVNLSIVSTLEPGMESPLDILSRAAGMVSRSCGIDSSNSAQGLKSGNSGRHILKLNVEDETSSRSDDSSLNLSSSQSNLLHYLLVIRILHKTKVP